MFKLRAIVAVGALTAILYILIGFLLLYGINAVLPIENYRASDEYSISGANPFGLPMLVALIVILAAAIAYLAVGVSMFIVSCGMFGLSNWARTAWFRCGWLFAATSTVWSLWAIATKPDFHDRIAQFILVDGQPILALTAIVITIFLYKLLPRPTR